MEFIPLIILFILLVLNIPVAYGLIISAVVYFLFFNTSLPVDMIFQRMIASGESYPLLAVPFFITAGVIMNYSGISSRLMALADLLTGHMRGGLAQANVLMSGLMGGVNGSQNADAAMISKIVAPEMVKRGYSPAFTAVITGTSATVVSIIPPAIGLILYAFMANVSIGKLFLAGYIPGVLMCVALMIAVNLISRSRGYKSTREKRASGKEVMKQMYHSSWALLLPLGIILGLRFGVFTATEAGAMAVFYSIVVGFFVYKELKISDLPKIIKEALLSTSSVMLIIVAAAAFGYYLNWERIPQMLSESIMSWASHPLMFLLLANLLLLFVGMFIEGTASLIILTPILAPIAVQLGIDPIHFGIVMVLNISIGAVTPPFGSLIFITSSILNVKLIDFFKELVWPLTALLIVLAVLTVAPWIVTFLPDLLM